MNKLTLIRWLILAVSVAFVAGLVSYWFKPDGWRCRHCGLVRDNAGHLVTSDEPLFIREHVCPTCAAHANVTRRPRTFFWFVGVAVILASPFAVLAFITL